MILMLEMPALRPSLNVLVMINVLGNDSSFFELFLNAKLYLL